MMGPYRHRVFRAVSALGLALAIAAALAPSVARAESDGDGATSETVALLHEAMRAAVTGRADRVQEIADGWIDLEADLRRQGHEPPRLSDNLAALAAAVTPDRQTRRERQEAALGLRPDALARDLLRRHLADDPFVEFRRLGRQELWNQTTYPINSAIRSVAGFFEGNPQSLFQFPVDMVFAVPTYFQLTDRRRKRLALAGQIADDPVLLAEAPADVFEKAHAYRERAHRQHRDHQLNQVRVLQRMGRLEEAVDLCQAILEEHPGHRGAYERLVAADRELSMEAARRIAAISVADNEPWPEDDGPIGRWYDAAVRGVIAGAGPPEMDGVDEATLAEWGLTDEAAYLKIVARQRHDAFAATQEAMADLARDDDDNMNRRARAWQATAGFNRDLALKQARSAVARDRRRYVLTGAPSGSENLYLMSSAAAQQSAGGAVNMGILNVLAVAIRTVQMMVTPVVSHGPVMDVLAEDIVRRPDDPEAQERRLRLARLAERMGWEDVAMEYYEAADALTDKKRATLRAREGDRVRRAIAQLPTAQQRVAGWQYWLENWDDLKAADRVRRDLEKDLAEASPAFRIDTATLRESPQRWLDLGAPLVPAWLDGQAATGELDDEGVAFLRDGAGQPLAEFRLQGRPALSRRPLSDAAFEQLRAAWEETRYQQRQREIGREERQTYYFPVDIDMGAGPWGVRAMPQLQRAPESPDLPLYRD